MYRLCEELEELLADILFCGTENISAKMLYKLESISENMKELGMNEGCRMVRNLYDEISSFRRNESDGKQIGSIISALEFYIQPE